MRNTTILHYIGQLENAMDGGLWVDETFDKKLSGIDEGIVFQRPVPGVHSVAEVISHLLEWRISVLSILRGEKRTLRDGSPLDWRNNEELSQIGWQSLISAFKKSQEEIVEVLRGKDDAFLRGMAKEETHELQYYVDGLLQHDMYHLGQIGLILKMLKTI